MREITGKVAFIIRRTGCSRAYVREGRESKVTLRVLISAITGVVALGILPSDALAMSVNFHGRGIRRAAQGHQRLLFPRCQAAQPSSHSKWWIKMCQRTRTGAESSPLLATAKFLRGPSRTRSMPTERPTTCLRMDGPSPRWKGGGISINDHR